MTLTDTLRGEGCGTCTLCCKLLGIPELDKPQDVWCEFCDKGKGCKVYGNHPTSCKDYECFWLSTQKSEDPIPVEFRPDKTKVILSVQGDEKQIVVAHVDPGYPHAWRKPQVYNFLVRIAAQGLKVVIGVGKGNRKYLMRADSKGRVHVHEVTMSDPDPQTGVQNLQSRLPTLP